MAACEDGGIAQCSRTQTRGSRLDGVSDEVDGTVDEAELGPARVVAAEGVHVRRMVQSFRQPAELTVLPIPTPRDRTRTATCSFCCCGAKPSVHPGRTCSGAVDHILHPQAALPNKRHCSAWSSAWCRNIEKPAAASVVGRRHQLSAALKLRSGCMGDDGQVNTLSFICSMGSSAGSLITSANVYFVGLSSSCSGLCSMNGIRNTPQAQPPETVPALLIAINPGGNRPGCRGSLHGQSELPEVVRTLHPPRGFARRLDGRQQQGHQDTDDGNDDQELDQRKRSGAVFRQGMATPGGNGEESRRRDTVSTLNTVCRTLPWTGFTEDFDNLSAIFPQDGITPCRS